MTAKELKRLSRADLLEMLIDQSKELQKTKKRLKIAEAALEEREIAIAEAGSIAEAALSVNGIFEAAQASCEQYMENIRKRSEQQEEICQRREADIRKRSEQQEEICRRREAESIEKAEQLLEDTMARCAAMESAAAEQCTTMIMEAKAQVDAYWASVKAKLEERYAENAGYSELLTLALVQEELKKKDEAQSRRRKKKRWPWSSRSR